MANVYELGGTVEIDITPTDQDGYYFTPTEVRLSVQDPAGIIATVSGGSLTTVSGSYLYYLYRPSIRGYHAYETWVKDSSGREIVTTHGFEITDTLQN